LTTKLYICSQLAQHKNRLCKNLNDNSAYLENCTIKISSVTRILICSVAQSKKDRIRKKHTPNETLKQFIYVDYLKLSEER